MLSFLSLAYVSRCLLEEVELNLNNMLKFKVFFFLHFPAKQKKFESLRFSSHLPSPRLHLHLSSPSLHTMCTYHPKIRFNFFVFVLEYFSVSESQSILGRRLLKKLPQNFCVLITIRNAIWYDFRVNQSPPFISSGLIKSMSQCVAVTFDYSQLLLTAASEIPALCCGTAFKVLF